MKLTNENYFSKEANLEYFGVSQLKQFKSCEASAIAEINGEYEPPMTTALLVGSFLDAYFEGTLDEFLGKHPEIIKRDGTLKADYVRAYDIISRIESDELFMEYMNGEKQVVMTGEIDGFPFKIKIDSYHRGDKIVDLKIMRSLERVMGMSLVEYWEYDLQAAIYREIEGNSLPFFLAIATKEEPPNIEIVEIDEYDMAAKLAEYRKYLPRWDKIKKGEVEPESCGVCSYCRSKKKLTKPIKSDMLGFNNKEMKFMEEHHNGKSNIL